MALNNPQSNFEDSIFGPNGTHPAPKTLPYPTQPVRVQVSANAPSVTGIPSPRRSGTPAASLGRVTRPA